MALNDLYTILSLDQNGDQINCQMGIDASHPVFQGHFPGSPVLPGVVQLEMVKSVLAKALGKPLALKEMSTCKFLEVFNPSETEEMTIHIQFKGDVPLDVSASGAHNGKTYFKIRASFS
ncbi:3-hydroxyacyl-ACP dehydratase [Dyadobacter sp. CY261]|uniref:3-hydroxyacyl-ACP dehydratase n=1 Tax=Dyadobacter sp. CY261 TaxID=2907203 RepID=UPI001F19F078|nr:3-hydroxyacyl-ACP dehydratase [Dyadobacter sp. CY261]MCF0073786.1 3-hydroxyacyl-ACP dehydratase [Dyadobacter sp. CY261]